MYFYKFIELRTNVPSFDLIKKAAGLTLVNAISFHVCLTYIPRHILVLAAFLKYWNSMLCFDIMVAARSRLYS